MRNIPCPSNDQSSDSIDLTEVPQQLEAALAELRAYLLLNNPGVSEITALELDSRGNSPRIKLRCRVFDGPSAPGAVDISIDPMRIIRKHVDDRLEVDVERDLADTDSDTAGGRLASMLGQGMLISAFKGMSRKLYPRLDGEGNYDDGNKMKREFLVEALKQALGGGEKYEAVRFCAHSFSSAQDMAATAVARVAFFYRKTEDPQEFVDSVLDELDDFAGQSYDIGRLIDKECEAVIDQGSLPDAMARQGLIGILKTLQASFSSDEFKQKVKDVLATLLLYFAEDDIEALRLPDDVRVYLQHKGLL